MSVPKDYILVFLGELSERMKRIENKIDFMMEDFIPLVGENPDVDTLIVDSIYRCDIEHDSLIVYPRWTKAQYEKLMDLIEPCRNGCDWFDDIHLYPDAPMDWRACKRCTRCGKVK